jgi:hypothetical protein
MDRALGRIAAFLVAVTLAMLVLAPASRAEDIAGADRAAIQALIAGQIEAFRHDDGAAAWGYASPMIQGQFPTPDAFMGMVRKGYQPVYRPRSVTFGPIADTPAGPMQKVYVTGPDGRAYIAVYTLERQPDGSWKINGCSLTEDNSPTI